MALGVPGDSTGGPEVVALGVLGDSTGGPEA